MLSSLPAIRLRPWATVLLLIGLLVCAFLALSSPAISPLASPAAGATDSEQPPVRNPVDEVVPDAIIQLGDSATFDEDFATLATDVADLAGVAWTASDMTADPRPYLVVGFEPGAERVALRSIDRFIEDNEAGDAITVGGRAVVDRSIAEHVGRIVRLVVILASLCAGGMAAWLARPHHGALVAVVVLVAGWLSSAMGGVAGGDFDGSLVTTSIPAVLAALIVSVFLCFRMLAWFEDPEGDDLAEMIRRSVYHLGFELLLFFGGLIVADVVLELVGPARSIATVVLAGALTSTLVTLAIISPALAAMHGAGIAVVPTETGDGEHPRALRAFLNARPSGRQFPVVVLLVFGFVFGFLGLLSVGTPTVPALLERSRTEAAVPGGDPTDALLAVFPEGLDQQAKASWLSQVSQLASVGRVDTSVARYVDGAEVALDGAPLGEFAITVEGDEAPGFALVVPTVTARSAAADDLVGAVRVVNAPVDAKLSGAMVDGAEAGARDRSVVWTTIVVLALITGITVYGLVGDLTLSALTAALRLLDSMAVVGIYHLVANAVSGAELLLVVFVTAIGAWLFELGFIRRLVVDHRSGDTEEMIAAALGREGLAAAVALLAAAAGSIGLIGGVGPLTRLGVVMIVAIGVEIVIGLWLLRPAILGHAAVLHFASQPVRRALRRLSGAGSPEDPDFNRWVTVVTALLEEEFRLQAEPGMAAMDSVFVGDTPLLHSAIEHHEQLERAGLRVTGRKPELRTLQVVAPGSPTTVAITVDHPVRHLVDRSGKIVGLRKAERRTVMLWLDPQADGSHRIADLVELGSIALEVVEQPAPAFAQAPQMSLE